MGALALLVVLLGVAAAPVVDAWSHFDNGLRGPAHGWATDCELCRVVAAPALDPRAEPTLAQRPAGNEGAVVDVSGDQVVSSPTRYHPPSRGPPLV
ncbi:MAG: hypothetical protein WD737_02755 [Gemmatimonadota bacterium]